MIRSREQQQPRTRSLSSPVTTEHWRAVATEHLTSLNPGHLGVWLLAKNRTFGELYLFYRTFPDVGQQGRTSGEPYHPVRTPGELTSRHLRTLGELSDLRGKQNSWRTCL